MVKGEKSTLMPSRLLESWGHHHASMETSWGRCWNVSAQEKETR